MTIEHIYQYAERSALTGSGKKSEIGLATSGGVNGRREQEANPFFFMGALTEPKITAAALTALAKVVGEHFTADRVSLKALKDPVVTSDDGVLRFEGFSGCCGLYARLDLDGEATDPVSVKHGTTNVDFGSSMRGALNRIGAGDSVSFSVGSEEVHLVHGAEVVTERKVDLPDRWIRGFTEAAVFQSRMEEVFSLGKAHALRLVRSIPARRLSNDSCWIVPSGGGGVRLSRSRSKGVHVHGLSRLAVLRELMPYLRGLRIFRDAAEGEASAWEVGLGTQTITFVLSPGLFRGFSGEGQALGALATETGDDLLGSADETLSWQASLRPCDLGGLLDVSEEDARNALLTLGAQGLVGYDLQRCGFFHRELPFDRGEIELLNPRLRSAKRLIAEQAVRWVSDSRKNTKAEVESGGRTYVVELRDPPPHRCNCRWFAAHGGKRGTCKHVLAAMMEAEN